MRHLATVYLAEGLKRNQPPNAAAASEALNPLAARCTSAGSQCSNAIGVSGKHRRFPAGLFVPDADHRIAETAARTIKSSVTVVLIAVLSYDSCESCDEPSEWVYDRGSFLFAVWHIARPCLNGPLIHCIRLGKLS